MTDEELLKQLRAIHKPSDPYVSLATLCAQAADRIEALGKERDEILQQAKSHACESDTANATIYDIYRACRNGNGVPGNWRGAQPVINELMARYRNGLREGLELAVREAQEAAMVWPAADHSADASQAIEDTLRAFSQHLSKLASKEKDHG